MPTPNNWRRLLTALLGPVQDLESTFQQLIINRTVDNATGINLDVIGRIVGQSRGGHSDDTYRRYIRARIKVNRSKGTIRDVIEVADLIVFDEDAVLHVENYGVAALHLIVEDIVVDDINLIQALILMLRDTVAAGVKIVVETWPLPEDELLEFDDEANPGSAGGDGLGNELDANDGSGLASAVG